jgi:hypothetical protein
VYLISAQITVSGETLPTNSVPLAIAPKITVSAGTVASGTNVVLSIQCTPNLQPGQQVSLIIGSQAAPADDFSAPTNTPSFTFQSLQSTAGPVQLRLRVDGIDSPIIDMTTTPPKFNGPTIQVT